MDTALKKDYEAAKNFWNNAFSMDDKERKETEASADRENGWKELAPSEKLFLAAQSLGRCKKILDYGCGRGWAAIIAAKSGCADVTAVDVSANAAESTSFYADLFGAGKQVRAVCVSDEWLSESPAEMYDGIFCSNVLDVIPEDVADGVLAHFARVVQKGAPVMIGMNYYMVPKDDPEKKLVVKNGNHVFLNNVLRLVCRTDEEWTDLLGRYFTVERLEHFAWPGEEIERRRLFYLRKNDLV